MKPGTDRYNAYVYGTLNKITGEYGVDNLLRYKPTFEFVHVPMIAAVFAILLLLYYFLIKPTPIGTFQGNAVFTGGPPKSSDMNYLNYGGWYSAQYQAGGAQAGYRTSKPEVLMPYNETIDAYPYPGKDI